MTDNNTDRPRSSLAVWLIVAVVLLLFAYVLSIGPFSWLCHRGHVDNRLVFYAPITYLREHCEPARQLIDWYIRLWW